MAKDKYHDLVKKALTELGWDITDDPYLIATLQRTLRVDLGAEKVIAAEKDNQKIAVEIKSFIGISKLHDFYKALGQFTYYHAALEDFEADRKLFLAIPETMYSEFFSEPLTQRIVEQQDIKLIVYSVATELIIKWIE